ncbi:MAG: hypothetical protein SPF80_00390, partial [Candidatus Cryptobacteroides sp.]|nr:hypothetical protein [Bacteroidales bacterium]MDY5494455.1 hypothetical protein [Candidatus Cryptobacteroides sp.]
HRFKKVFYKTFFSFIDSPPVPAWQKRLSQTADQQKKRPPPNYLKHNSYEKEYSRSLKDLNLVYEDNPDTIPSLEQLYAMLLETLEKIPENH